LIGETVQLISEIMKVQVETEQEGQRVRPEKSEVERLWACNLKAKKILNWTPVYGGRAGFVKGLEETIAWLADSNNLKSYKSNIYNI
jgi:dTDP-glucose 4,6-dehydratase